MSSAYNFCVISKVARKANAKTMSKIRRPVGSTKATSLQQENAQREESDAVGVSAANTGVTLSSADPVFERALAASRDFMERYPRAMKELAQ